MKKTLLLSPLALVLFFCTFVPHSFAATEAAKVNGQVITLEEVNQHLADVTRTNPVTAPNKKTVLDDLIKREVAIQEAKKMKLELDPMVADRLNNVLFFAFIEKRLQKDFDKMTVSDAEAKNWYDKNPEIRTSQIFVAVSPEGTVDDEARAQKKLNEALSDVKSGKMSFAEAAQKFSEDPSAAVGGDLEYRMKDRLDPNFYKAAIKLGKPGDLTGIVRSAYGFHVVRLTGKHAWSEVDRVRVKRIIIEERRQELVGRLLNDLRQKANVSVNSAVIKE